MYLNRGVNIDIFIVPRVFERNISIYTYRNAYVYI